MATYPGMSLGGEVRESVSLDEDDLSDVEDEVFIRDGKNGYKFAEDAGVKRPLMAPRRKLTKSDFGSRIRNRPMCWSLCRPCCYVFSGLILLIGLIALVVILVSLFPLPIDKLKNWLISKTRECFTEKLLPCSDLVVTDVWTVSLPKLTSESAIRVVDINADGIDDIIFGFGTGDNYDINPDIFCTMFFDMEPPCGGGLTALNGSNGEILWTRWLPHAVFIIYCNVDVNADGIPDCLATGKAGIFCMIDARNGSIIWQFDNKYTPQQPLIIDIYMANYIPDQDGDGIDDILTAHTSKTDLAKTGHLILVSGKTGDELKRVETPKNAETFYPPQILTNDIDTYVLFGTGSPTSPGNLSVVPLEEIVQGYIENITTLFQDTVKGVISPSVLVDITGDNITDIIISLFNSTTIAVDGSTFKQIWNLTIPNSETLSIPTPAYFNEDNVTDFLVKYQIGSGFPVYYYSQAFIIDGKNGKPIYSTPIIDSVGSQMGGLTLTMEHRGLDWFLFWTADCKGFEGHQEMYEFISGSTTKQQNHADICKLRFNSTMFAKLNALNQYFQPPGLEIYNSDYKWLLEYSNIKAPLEEAKEYITEHPEFGSHHTVSTPSMETAYKINTDSSNAKHKDVTTYRHKTSQGLEDDYLTTRNRNMLQDTHDITQYPQEEDFETDYNNYPDMTESMNLYQQTKPLSDTLDNGNRDARSKNKDHSKDSREKTTESTGKTQKKNLADMTKHGIYDYGNVRNARSRLLHDLNAVPNDILQDTYFKTRENQLRRSRFEQRDLLSHKDRIKENAEVGKTIDEEQKNAFNVSENLWTLESDKEAADRQNGYNIQKRGAAANITGIPRLTSVGTLAQTLDPTVNAIDLVFLTYWLPPVKGAQLVLEKDVQCISDKLKKALASKEKTLSYQKSTLEELVKKECIEEGFKQTSRKPEEDQDEENRNIPYYNQISRLNLGQMTVYRVRIECRCETPRKGERCARFLDLDKQGWSSYLGGKGDGMFQTKL